MTKIVNLIGLAKRASKLIAGTDIVIANIRKNKVYFVIILEDASENTKKKLLDKCKYYNCEVSFIENCAELQKVLNSNKKALGITDKGFAEAIKKER